MADTAKSPHVRQAIQWWVMMQSGTASAHDHAGLESWLQHDPRHQEAWARVCEVQQGVRRVPAALARSALGQEPARRLVLRNLAVVSASALLGWGIYRHTPWQRLIADSSTTLGQNRILPLGQGLALTLASDSAVRVSDAAEASFGRRVHLLRGEVLVQAQEAGLRLDTGFGELESRNARFCVRRGQHACHVELMQGELIIRRGGDLITVHASQGLRLPASGAIERRAPNPDATAWLDGMVVAQDWTLRSLIKRLGQHRHGFINVDDDVADLRVSGVFPLYDAELALHAVAQTLAITVVRRGPYWLNVVPRST